MKPPAGPLEAALLAALRADPPDPTAVEAARVALVEKWAAYARRVAGTWHARTRRGELADYYRAGVVGLWEGATRFDPTSGVLFGSYAGWWVLRYVRAHTHAEAGGGFHVPINHGITQVAALAFGGIQAEDSSPFDQSIPAPEPDPVEEPPDAAEVWAVIDRTLVDPRHRAVLRGRFRDEKTLDEVGRDLGVSKERVRQMQQQAMARIRKHAPQLAGMVAG